MECLLGPSWNYTEQQCRRMWRHNKTRSRGLHPWRGHNE